MIATLLTALALAPTPAPPYPWRAHSTAYCLRGRMADGTFTRRGSAASNRHRLGTLIRLRRPAFGRRSFRVRDRIGWGSQLDLWTGSCWRARQYGRRAVRYRVVGR